MTTFVLRNKIRFYRKRASFNRCAFAISCGICPDTLSRLELERVNPSCFVALSIFNVLHDKLPWILFSDLFWLEEVSS